MPGGIGKRQRLGEAAALIELDVHEIVLAAERRKARAIVRAFVGMVIHHSLNNNLWDRKRRLLKISNEDAAREFTDILLHGVTSMTRRNGLSKKAAGKNSRKKSSR